MIFVDTSAFVAIIAEEDDAKAMADRLEALPRPVTSPLVLVEAAMVLSSRLKISPMRALDHLMDFIRLADIAVTDIELEHVSIAVGAFGTYGKGRGHPAQLNLADCLSYACAKSKGLSILYKGDDFSQTDLAGRPHRP